MRLLSSLALLGTILANGLAGAAEPTDGDAAKCRIGVYDNRAIAVAYSASKYNPVAQKMEAYRKAEDAGDQATMSELRAWGQRHQRQLHRQGFGRVPVTDLLAHVKDQLPEVARRHKLTAITWQCDFAGDNVEVVDVTEDLVRLYEPDDRVWEIVKGLKDRAPVDLDELEKMHEH